MIFERDSPDKAGPGRPMPILSPTQRIDAEHVNLALILNLIRSNEATTRQEIEHQSGLGRAIVTDRLATLTELGLIDEGELGPTTGGRAPRNFRFCDDAGIILLAVIGQSTIGVGVSDLSGRLHVEHHESADTNNGPAAIVKRLFTLFDWVLEQRHNSREVWGIGIAVSAPVEDSFGQPFTTPVLHFMPGWDDYPLIEHLAVRRASSYGRYCVSKPEHRNGQRDVLLKDSHPSRA